MSIQGSVITEWLEDGRNMKLLSVVEFTDTGGYIWSAKPGMIFDGASIPRIFWRLIGCPYCGKYRRAAVLHDAYYGLSSHHTRKSVDKMFLEAMRSDGVSWLQSRAMYYAVRLFGEFAWRA